METIQLITHNEASQIRSVVINLLDLSYDIYDNDGENECGTQYSIPSLFALIRTGHMEWNIMIVDGLSYNEPHWEHVVNTVRTGLVQSITCS